MYTWCILVSNRVSTSAFYAQYGSSMTLLRGSAPSAGIPFGPPIGEARLSAVRLDLVSYREPERSR